MEGDILISTFPIFPVTSKGNLVVPALEQRLRPLSHLRLGDAVQNTTILFVADTASRPPPLGDVLRPGRRPRRSLGGVFLPLLVLDGGDGGLAVEAEEEEVDEEAEGEQGQDDAVRARLRHDGA